MAHDLNPDLVAGIRSVSNWRGIARHKSRRVINLSRRLSQTVSFRGGSTEKVLLSFKDPIAANFDLQADHYRQTGWAFVQEFFTAEVFEAVQTNWPGLRWFQHKGDPTKSYDFGPRWTKRSKTYVRGINPAFYSGFESLCSDDFARRVTDFCGDGRSRVTGGPTAVWARQGSHLLPHLDDMSKFESSVVNIIIFVEGTAPSIESGGTSLFYDNTYEKPMFIPPSLTNSALIYSTGSEFYHGFPRVARGKFSKRIVLNFQPIDLLSRENVLSSESDKSAS